MTTILHLAVPNMSYLTLRAPLACPRTPQHFCPAGEFKLSQPKKAPRLDTNEAALCSLLILTGCRSPPVSLFHIRFPPAWLSSDFQLVSAVSRCLSFCSRRGGRAEPSAWSISATTTCPPLVGAAGEQEAAHISTEAGWWGAHTSDVKHAAAHKCIINTVT